MSHFENYLDESQFYDNKRTAVGIEIIRNQLGNSEIPINKQLIVDAGCGTGLSPSALVKFVRKIEAIDLNEVIFNIVKDKMKKMGKDGLINFYLSSIDSLTIENNTADAVIGNKGLHHLPDNSVYVWEYHKKVFREF